MIDLKKFIFKPYYYVPPCPACGSKLTGRFIKIHGAYETNWAINESLKNGELVSAQPEIPEDKTAFCAECGYSWFTNISLKLFNLRRIADEKKIRCTNDLLKERCEESMEEKKEKKSKHGIIYNSITGFVGRP